MKLFDIPQDIFSIIWEFLNYIEKYIIASLETVLTTYIEYIDKDFYARYRRLTVNRIFTPLFHIQDEYLWVNVLLVRIGNLDCEMPEVSLEENFIDIASNHQISGLIWKSYPTSRKLYIYRIGLMSESYTKVTNDQMIFIRCADYIINHAKILDEYLVEYTNPPKSTLWICSYVLYNNNIYEIEKIGYYFKTNIILNGKIYRLGFDMSSFHYKQTLSLNICGIDLEFTDEFKEILNRKDNKCSNISFYCIFCHSNERNYISVDVGRYTYATDFRKY